MEQETNQFLGEESIGKLMQKYAQLPMAVVAEHSDEVLPDRYFYRCRDGCRMHSCCRI